MSLLRYSSDSPSLVFFDLQERFGYRPQDILVVCSEPSQLPQEANIAPIVSAGCRVFTTSKNYICRFSVMLVVDCMQVRILGVRRLVEDVRSGRINCALMWQAGTALGNTALGYLWQEEDVHNPDNLLTLRSLQLSDTLFSMLLRNMLGERSSQTLPPSGQLLDVAFSNYQTLLLPGAVGDIDAVEYQPLTSREVVHNTNKSYSLSGNLEQILEPLGNKESVRQVLNGAAYCPITRTQPSVFAVALCCCNAYDKDALESWFERSNMCPMCRCKEPPLLCVDPRYTCCKFDKLAEIIAHNEEFLRGKKLVVVAREKPNTLSLVGYYQHMQAYPSLPQEAEHEWYEIALLDNHEEYRKQIGGYSPLPDRVHLVY